MPTCHTAAILVRQSADVRSDEKTYLAKRAILMDCQRPKNTQAKPQAPRNKDTKNSSDPPKVRNL